MSNEERGDAAAEAIANFDRGCLLVFLAGVFFVALVAVLVGLSAMSTDDDKPGTDACTRAFVGDRGLLTKCYRIVGTGVSPPDAVVIVRNTARDYGRP